MILSRKAMASPVDSEASDQESIEFSVKLNAPRVPSSLYSSCAIRDNSERICFAVP